jgi:hypothetical protein
MATNSYVGKVGSVTSGAGNGTKIANIKDWSMTVNVGSADTTSFGDKDATMVQTIRSASGQISGDLSTDATENTLMDQVSTAGTLSSVILALVVSTVAGKKGKWMAQAAQLTSIGGSGTVAGVFGFNAAFNFSGGVKWSTT